MRTLHRPEITGTKWDASELFGGWSIESDAGTVAEEMNGGKSMGQVDAKYIAASPKAWEWLEKRWKWLESTLRGKQLDLLCWQGEIKELAELDEILLAAGYRIINE